MQAKDNVSKAPDEVIAEIVLILARGYMRFRKARRIPPNCGHSAEDVAQFQESEEIAKKPLDSTGRRCLIASAVNGPIEAGQRTREVSDGT